MELLNHLQNNRNTAALDLIEKGTDLTFIDQVNSILFSILVFIFDCINKPKTTNYIVN